MDPRGTSHQISRDEIQRQVFQKQKELQKLQALLENSSSNPAQSHQSESVVDPVRVSSIPQHDGASLKRSRTFPRNHSSAGHPSSTMPHGPIMIRHHEVHQPIKRSRVMSQQYSSSPAMASSMSRSTSSRSAKTMPFVAHGPVAPLQTSSSTPTTSNLNRFYQSKDDSQATANMYPATMQGQHSTQQRAELPRVEENCTYPDVGMNPLDFLAAYDDDFPSAPVAPPPQHYSMTFSEDPRRSNASHVTSGCPSMISGTSAAETIPLTRDNSSYDATQLATAIEMARIESTQSQRTDFTDDNFYSLSQGMVDAKQEDLFAFTGANLSAPGTQPYGSSLPMEHTLSCASVGMERSMSASSVERRAREARQRQIQNAKKANLMPKPAVVASLASQPAKKEGKVAVSKNGGYTRPKHPKVKCNQCDDHPEGFRGEHELKRHISAKHTGVVKKFVCRDPATVGIHSNVEAVNPLSKCKQCQAKKQYGAYYNAAAHLRRTHFKPKTPRNKHKKGEDEEKRGGKGGGDWPPMNELKNWFEEITVSVENADLDDDDDMDAFEDNAAWDTSFSSMPDGSFAVSASYTAGLPNLGIDTTGSADTVVPMSAASFSTSSATGYDFSPFIQSPMAGVSPEGNFATATPSGGATPGNFQSFDDIYTPFPLEIV